ncbi:hypothetical protein [Nocardioides sp. YIM 152588]|uniref:hypothetical protein n=1 Tax=Nocardioides sp. YIM 152588 TaxID=3158259 RepID=UPI0032E4EDA4
MSLTGDPDVVIIGLGGLGELAATAASLAGLRVMILERRSRDELGERGLDRLERVAPLVSGVRLGTTVHELVVEDGRIVGAGYADRSGDVVGRLSAPSVVLALGRSHWEFVGSAAWCIERGRPRPEEDAEADAAVDDPELRVRRWCATHDATYGPASTGCLVADTMSGVIKDAAGRPVPGLYTVADRADLVDFTRSLVASDGAAGGGRRALGAPEETLSLVV